MGLVLAVDIGATWIRVAAFEGAELKAKRAFRMPQRGDHLTVAGEVAEEGAEVLAGMEPDFIGVASIGPLDLDRGWVVGAPNAPIREFSIVEPLARRFNARVVLANDAVAAAWGEYVLGGGRGRRDIAYVTLSTGIGVGIIVDGNLLVGRRGNSHEAGHIVVDMESSLVCGCGGKGHWEAMAGGASIPRTARHFTSSWNGGETRAYRLAKEGALTAERAYELARSGDEFALELISFLNKVHAAGFASIIAAYDPEIIFVGGSIYLNNEDLIRPQLLSLIKEYSLLGVPEIRKATFGGDAPLYGAASLAIRTPGSLAGRWETYGSGA